MTEKTRFNQILVEIEGIENACDTCGLPLYKTKMNLGHGLELFHCKECDKMRTKSGKSKI